MTILLASINIYTTCLPGIQRSPNRVSQFGNPNCRASWAATWCWELTLDPLEEEKSALELRSHLFSLTNQISYFILRLNKQPLISNAFSHFIFPHQTYSLELNQTLREMQLAKLPLSMSSATSWCQQHWLLSSLNTATSCLSLLS